MPWNLNKIQLLIGVKNRRSTQKGHHTSLYRKQNKLEPSKYERYLCDHHPILDQYVKQLKQNAPGKGTIKLKRLLTLQRTTGHRHQVREYSTNKCQQQN